MCFDGWLDVDSTQERFCPHAREHDWQLCPSFTLLLRASWSSEQIWDVLLVSGKMRFSEIAITGVSHGRVGGREFRPDIVCFIICSKCVCWRWKEELLKRDGEKNCLRSEWPALLSLLKKGSKIKIWMKLERVRLLLGTHCVSDDGDGDGDDGDDGDGDDADDGDDGDGDPH